MDKLNLDKLSAKMQELNLSEDDVIAMLDTPKVKGEDIIPTPLWVVYKKNNVIILKDGLDLKMKPYVWGIQARRNLLISRLLAEDMPDAKAEWRRCPYGDSTFLPNYASKLDYQGREIVPAKGQDIYCLDETDYDETAKILQKHGVDCIRWSGRRLEAVDWEYVLGDRRVEKVDATCNFICDGYSGVHTYEVKAGNARAKVEGLNCWVPGRMALWIK